MDIRKRWSSLNHCSTVTNSIVNATLNVKIWRGAEAGSYQSYAVPRSAQQTILDVVTYIQRELDSSLSYRFSCRVGMCGTCAMTVNGTPRWTCRTQASIYDGAGNIDIAPLSNFPIIKDLVVNMDPFFDKWKAATSTIRHNSSDTQEFATIKPDSTKRKAANKAIECIGCGVCYSACDVVRWNSDYYGPAALNRAWSLLNDERYDNQEQLIDSVSTGAGCLSCHTTRSCTRYCPKELDPSGSIAGLKQEILRTLF